VPCGCEECFFCKNGLTHGVDHEKKGKKRRSRSARPECDIKRGPVSKTPRRCLVCYKNQRALNPTLDYRVIEKQCKQSRLGCTTCEIIVCAGCWMDFDHTVL
jgi:hypothetical protein